jgi:hypothetical protein
MSDYYGVEGSHEVQGAIRATGGAARRTLANAAAVLLAIVAALATAGSALACEGETAIEVLEPMDGATFHEGDELAFAVSGQVVNQRSSGQQYFLVLRIRDGAYNDVMVEIIDLGELDHCQVVDFSTYEVFTTRLFGVGDWTFSGAVGPHWHLAPDESDRHDIEILPDNGGPYLTYPRL